MTILLVLIGVAFSIWYYYIDTLSMSEIIAQSNNTKVDILVHLFDFDTGITRHEMNQLSQKAEGWKYRMDEITRIQDLTLQQAEREKRLAEMMRDPSSKKVVKIFLKSGAKSGKNMLEIMSVIKSFTLF